MSSITLASTNGSITLTPEDGASNVDITVPRSGVPEKESGMVRRVLHHYEAGADVSTASTAYTTFISFVGVDFDTDNYNYVIMMNHNVKSANGASAGGANLEIRIGATKVMGSGHRGFNMPNDSHMNQATYSPLITSGFVGTYNVLGNIAAYTPGEAVNIHNNGGTSSPDPWEMNARTMTIYELYK